MLVRPLAAVILISTLALIIGGIVIHEIKGVAGKADTSPPDEKEPVSAGDKDTDLKLLQGSWNCVLRTIGEKELYPSQGKRTLEIKGDSYGEGTLTVDNSAKPKRLDVKMANGDDKGKTLKGIYEFREGKLIWCFNNAPDGPRPETFDAEEHAKGKSAGSIEICTFEKAK